MRVAAIVVAHNSAADLPRSLGCLGPLGLSQIVVVDNASTDDSVRIARRFTPYVRTLPNVGFGAAVNAAADEVPDADAYLLLNPDCAIDAVAFADLVEALRADTTLAAVGPVMRYPNGRFGISSGSEPSLTKEWLAALRVDHLVPRRLAVALARAPGLKRVRLLRYVPMAPGPASSGLRSAASEASGATREDGAARAPEPARAERAPSSTAADWLSGFCLLVRAVAFREVGGFDPRFFLYFEDVDLCRRLRERGWTVATVGTSVADHAESTSTAKVGKTRLYRAGMYVYFSKHGTRAQRLVARVLRMLPI